MKKMIIHTCLFLSLLWIMSVNIYATNPNLLTFSDDIFSSTVKDSVKISDDERTLIESYLGKDKVILKLYSGAYLLGFAESVSIEALASTEYTLEAHFFCTDDMNSGQDPALLKVKNGEVFRISSHDVVDFTVFYRCVFFYDQLFSSLLPTAIDPNDLTISEIYCLNGSFNYEGVYVYYVTDRGDYVYYKEYIQAEDEYLMPVNEFYDFASRKHAERLQMQEEEPPINTETTLEESTSQLKSKKVILLVFFIVVVCIITFILWRLHKSRKKNRFDRFTEDQL